MSERSDKFKDKVKKFVKDPHHQEQILVFSSGMVVGILTTRYMYERNLRSSIEGINDNIYSSFTENQGNFRQADGSFPIPKIVKL